MASQPGPAPHASEASHAPPKPRIADSSEAASGNGTPMRHLQRSIGNRALAKLARSVGRPLEPSIRAELEAQMGEDLSTVRVHHDRESAESLGAQGFAVGEHVVTRATPTHDDASRKLLAHEIGHVLEQRHGPKEIARQEEAHPQQPSFMTTPSDDGFMDLSVDGVKILHYQAPDPEHPHDLNVGAIWTPDYPKNVYLGFWGKQTTTVLLDTKGVEELRQRGLEVIHKDMRQPVDLGEHPIHLDAIAQPPPPPIRRHLSAPKSPDKKVQDKTPPAKLPDTPVEETKSDQQGVLPPLPADTQTTTAPAAAPPMPKDLIDQRTSWWGNLDEDALGADLLKQAMNSDPDYAQHVLDEVGSTDRDDVSLAFAQAATDEQLQKLASTERGRRLLDRLFDELTDGEVFADEQQQADRILGIKTRSLLSEEQLAVGITKAKRSGLILPYRKLGLTVWEPSPIYAYRLPDGKITVHLATNIMGTDYAHDPDLRFISGDMILKEDEIVGVKRYDEGGAIEFMPALKLLQLTNEDTTRALEKAGEAFGIGLTFGFGGEAAVGGEATEGTAVSTTARLAAAGRKGLVVADRVATALDIGNSILQEHRGWVIETWPKEGREFVTSMDQLTSYVRIYGIVRGGVGLVQLGNNLRKSYRNWRAFSGAMKELSGSEKADIEKIGSEIERLLQELDSATNIEDISSAEQRRYPSDVARKLEATPEGQGDVLPLRRDVAANEDVEAEIAQQHAQQQPDEQQMKLASGDIETHAMAGPRRPKKPPVRRGTMRTTTRPTGGRFGGGAAFDPPTPRPQLRRVLPEHLDEPKLLPRGINNYGASDAFDFFRKNQATYPKHVQDMIATVQVPTRSANEAIDAALREFYGEQANVALGFPATSRQVARPAPVPGGRILEQTSPFTTSEKGHAPSRANPGTEVEAGFTPTPLGDRKNLNLVGHTKSGEVVKLDDFNFSDRSGEEIKMPDALASDPRYAAGNQDKIVDELRRHYQFTKDWGFNAYRWTLLSEKDFDIVRELARENLPSGWERYVTISWIDAGPR